jgi:hypothetical protein
MYAMIMGPCGGKAGQGGEHVIVGLDETFKQGRCVVAHVAEATSWRDVVVCGTQALPEHPPAMALERHAQVVEVPQDGA